MRQVIKHRDIRLLKMIRRTDPVIPPVIPVIFACVPIEGEESTCAYYLRTQ